MPEDCVGRAEFNALKDEVESIRDEMTESSKILQHIDKKIDVISEKLANTDKIDTLKFSPIEKRIDALEESQKWLRKTIIGEIVAVVSAAIIYAVKNI